MQAKDFLQIDKQVELLVAFQTIMKGELAKETKAAKEALKELQEGKDLDKTKKELQEDLAAYQKYQTKTEQHFQDIDEKLKTQRQGLLVKEQALIERAQKLAEAEESLKVAGNALKKEQYAFEESKKATQTQLTQTAAELQGRLDKFQSRIDVVAAREVLVEKKLAVLKDM